MPYIAHAVCVSLFCVGDYTLVYTPLLFYSSLVVKSWKIQNFITSQKLSNNQTHQQALFIKERRSHIYYGRDCALATAGSKVLHYESKFCARITGLKGRGRKNKQKLGFSARSSFQARLTGLQAMLAGLTEETDKAYRDPASRPSEAGRDDRFDRQD